MIYTKQPDSDTEVLHFYQRMNAKRNKITFITLIGVIGALLIDLMVGSSDLTISDVFRALINGPKGESITVFIIWNVRLPMTFICLWVGASLGLAGNQLQTILVNPLASPYTLGISSAAGFGAAVAFITGFPLGGALSWINAPLLAFIMTILSTMVIFILGKTKGMQSQTMILLGIIIHFLFQSLLSLIQFRSIPEVGGQILYWMFGSLLKSTWTGVKVSGVIFIACAIILSRYAWRLTALSIGEERAKSLGINTQQVKLHVFILSALLTAGAVSFVGTIGFIGLVAPHFARMLVGEDQRYLAPMSAMFGVLLMVCASITAKLLIPGIIVPIGIVTSLIGIPFLAYMILRRKKNAYNGIV
ncbi:ABC-type Fe3+-siderophore transport system, permease component [Clostridium aceticum]|uniref:ABC-type Fe3+-siderophore transport system, permease component n=1 Tax=Clostridium aceticum TaxID=84022 RepID=A0A0D8IAI1_9CLOT|nr:iron ABC transporter permease [Clostridium aceticum]AKL96559.1 ABC-type Fe3+-siderophore transport system, permease component [Clostridium aceticum]KJF27283.1 iron-siderophore ABC transporter permease [Clostridium aceticum]